LPNSILSEANNEFFVNGLGLSVSDGLAKFDLMETLANLCLVIGFFYKTLADRYGRKPFLIFNTIGHARRSIALLVEPNLITYIIGFFVIRFFVTPDEQIVYIYENRPRKETGIDPFDH
jgi:MFS family permease